MEASRREVVASYVNRIKTQEPLPFVEMDGRLSDKAPWIEKWVVIICYKNAPVFIFELAF